MAKTVKIGRSPLSANHKDALAKGRTQGSIIRRYLDALEQQRPRRGRRRSPESTQRRIEAIQLRIERANSLEKVHLRQELLDRQAELNKLESTDRLSTLEADFIKVAREYSERKSISYPTWRASGISPSVLEKAGIERKKKR